MKKECIRDGGMKMGLLPALAVVVILLAAASVGAADPATVNAKDGTYCNTEWEKTVYLDWTVPADAPTGQYGFVSATWDSCWAGCEGTPCHLDGCCDGEQNRYEEAGVFEVVS